MLPKKSFLTEYSYRTSQDNQRRLLAGWVSALSGLLFPQANTFSLDFHPIPYRGDDAGLETHYIPLAGKAQPSVLSFFALEQDSRVLCYANANLTRTEQPGEVMRFVEFWHELTGSDPAWLYFDSKVTTYPELHRLNQRRRQLRDHPPARRAVGAPAARLPASAWSKAVIDTPKRFHQQVRYVDERVRLPGYAGQIRQVAVDGLGNERPTLLISNNEQETARNLIIRYAGRNRVEDGLGSCGELLPPGLPGERGEAERGPGRGADGGGERLLPLAGAAAEGVREGAAEAAVPALRGDGGVGGGATRIGWW